MATEYPASLAAFFVFNPTLGEEETEGKKNLFFHPAIDINRQKDYIGLTEGIVNFTRDFSPDKPCEALRCEKTRHAFFECEKDFWFVLIINNPYVIKSRNSPNPVYLEDELADSTLQAVVKRAYATFRVFNGSLTAIAENHSYEFLKQKLKFFMSYFIPTVDFPNVRFSLDIRGFSFMPVNRNSFLMTQYIANFITSSFPHVSSCAMMYDKKLIWSGLEQDDMFFLYQLDQKTMSTFFEYLALNLEKPTLDSAASSPDQKGKMVTHKRTDSAGGNTDAAVFLTGPCALNVDVKPMTAPSIYLQTYNWKRKRLATFRCAKITLFMIMADTAESSSVALYEEMAKLIKPDVQKLALALSRQGNPDSKTSDSYRFLYFNALNLALVSTLDKDSTPQVSMDTIKLIRKIHEDFRINSWKGYSSGKKSEKGSANDSEGRAESDASKGERHEEEKKSDREASVAADEDKKTNLSDGEKPEEKASQGAGLGDEVGVEKRASPGSNMAGAEKMHATELSAEAPATNSTEGQETAADLAGKGESSNVGDVEADKEAEAEVTSSKDEHSASGPTELDQSEQKTEGLLAPDAKKSDSGRLEKPPEGTPLSDGIDEKSTPNGRGLDGDIERPSSVDTKGSLPGKVNGSKSSESYGETTPIHVAMKTKSDGWLVASKATQTQREFFVLVDHKNANLTTIQEEVNRLARSYFAKIFMH